MQELKMPYHKVQEMFSISEMAMMSWASAEMFSDMDSEKPKSVFDSLEKPQSKNIKDLIQSVRPPEEHQVLVKKEDMGDDDLRQYKGRQIYQFFAKQGTVFPIIVKDKPVDRKAMQRRVSEDDQTP